MTTSTKRAVHSDCGRECSSCASVRLWGQVERGDGCWEFGGHLNKGYGRFRVDGRDTYAHRIAYESTVGPIPEGLHIDHLCRNPRCVRPDHLEPVPSRVNTLRGEGPTARASQRTHCPKGHAYDADTLIVSPEGWRICKPCKRQASRDAKQRARERAALAADDRTGQR